MKKVVSLILLVVFTLTLSACGKVEYTSVDLQEMHSLSYNNPLKAKEKYFDEYICVKNVTIDIIYHYNVIWAHDESGLGIECVFNDKSSVKEIVTNLNVGDTVTVKGKVNSIGGSSQYGANTNVKIWLMEID